MKNETKVLLGILLATVAIIAVGIFLMGRGASSGRKADATLLVRPDSEKIATGSGVIMLVEFADYQCPACGAYYPVVKQLISEFHDSMTFVYRNFPLSQHKNAYLAAQAAEASGKQGAYWQMHDLLFEKQHEWSESDGARDLFIGYARSVALNADQFTKDIDAKDTKAIIDRDLADGNSLGVNATPTFYLNGDKLDNPASLSDFETLTKAALLKAPKPSAKANEPYHIHANIAVYVNGKAMDFSVAKYQSSEANERNPWIHLHDGKGDLIHVHKKGMTLGDFFTSLGMSLTKDCLSDDEKHTYCNSGNRTVKLYVNGQPNDQVERYEPKDLDRILVSYGEESGQSLNRQIQRVADDACVYSLTCPQRGTPPTEQCVGGLGIGCKE